MSQKLGLYTALNAVSDSFFYSWPLYDVTNDVISGNMQDHS